MNEKVVNRRLKNSQRGVTLIALVLSIVAMVIMAGVSVSVITGDDGLMAKAIRAENQKKMGEYEEKIKLAAINAKSEMNLEGNIKEKFIEKLEDMGFTVLTPEEDAELQANQIKVRTDDGFEFIYSINDSADIVLLDQRINGKPYATLTLEQVGMEGTANEAIKIRATTSIAEGGQITLLECLEIQTDDPNDKTGKKENPDPVVEFTVPGSGTYTVRATTKDGNTTTKRITIAINTISNKITITPSTTSPRNTGESGEQNGITKGPVTLTISFEETELSKQYKKYGDENWTNVTGTSKTISVTANETYVARYYDGKNGYNQETYNVVNVDNVAPTFTQSNVVALAEGVNVTVTITDPATDEASANASNTTAGILRYEYRLEDGTTGSAEPSVLTKTLTSSKLGEQKVYVKAIDKAGNATEVEKTVTVTVLNTTMNITASPLTPRNTIGSGTVNGVAQGPITLTITYGVTSLQKQYKKDGDQNWTTTNDNTVTINNITENCTYVARYWDGTNGSAQLTYNVENVDNVAPTFNAENVTLQVNDNIITATVTTPATDTASEGAGSGIAGILRYEFKLDDESYQVGDTSTSKALTATTMGSHTVYVKAIDNAGNETEVQKTESVGLASNTINISATPTTPRNTIGSGNVNGVDQGPITLTINYGTTSFTKQYKKGNGSWVTVTSGNSVQISETENCTYVARYWDGTNGRETETYNISNVDNDGPTFIAANISVTANQGTITTTINTAATDTAGIKGYKYKLGTTGSYQNSGTFTVTESGSYTVYVKAIDNAGNETEVHQSVNVSLIPKISEVTTISQAKTRSAKAVDTGITTLKDDNNKDVKIPAKFHIASDSATVVADGIVIEDASGNQFVWIPVDNISSYTRTAFSSNVMTSTTDSATSSQQIKDTSSSSYYYKEAMPSDEYSSVNTNKGYYIGRYEAGDSTKPTGSGQSLRESGASQTNAVAIKKGYAPYNYISRTNAKTRAEAMDSEQNYTGVTTKLCSSYAWDTAISFMQGKVSNYGSSSPQGNYSNVTAFKYTDITGTEQNKVPYAIIPTGQTTAVCNIYDMGGNVAEWTTETCSYFADPYTHCGGGYSGDYGNSPAGKRYMNTGSANDYRGFRITLYL